ncbi:serine/threonine protein kinase, CMGC, dual-specificity [Savitreella phatthalungensis]
MTMSRATSRGTYDGSIAGSTQLPPRTPSASYERPTMASMSRSKQVRDLASLARIDANNQSLASHRKSGINTSRKLPKSTSNGSLSSPRKGSVHGLGARTRSPTEAARQKRLSQQQIPKLPPPIDEHVQIPQLVAGSSVTTASTSTPPHTPKSLSSHTEGRPRSVTPPIPPLPPLQTLSKPRLPNLDMSRRHRSATVAAVKHHNVFETRGMLNDSSFQSPVKGRNVPLPELTADDQPGASSPRELNLPPLRLKQMGTPLVRKLDLLESQHHMTESAEVEAAEAVSAIQKPKPHTKARETTTTSPTSTPPRPASKAREALGLLRRLSLSRSSSRQRNSSTANGVPQRKLSESAATAVADVADHNETTPRTTPSRQRRLSISWLKGKISPFGVRAPSMHFDSSTPPAIPKSFTSESLADLAGSTDGRSDSELATPQTGSFASLPRVTRVKKTSSVIAASPALRTQTAQTEADEEVAAAYVARHGQEALDADMSRQHAMHQRVRTESRRRTTDETIWQTEDAPLNLYERGEVADYKDKVYFAGLRDVVKPGGRLDASTDANFDYDDNRGDYKIVPGDHLAYRYEIVDVLGKGSFGQVVCCLDHKLGIVVAIKLVRNKRRFHAQALIEVDILKRLHEWDPDCQHNTLRYREHFYFRHHLCIVSDVLSMNLYELTKLRNFKGCSMQLVRSFASQILQCLSLLSRHGVIHCDLKPENILLVNAWQSDVRVIDFGSSCFQDQRVYTYIQSRFYRSPEVILGMSYGLGIDIWSLGCIVAELLTGVPLFPGEDEQEQLGCIMEIFGPPERRLVEHSSRAKLFFDAQGRPKPCVSSKGVRRRPSTRSLAQAIRSNDDKMLDFLTRCLKWDPQKRMTPEQALKHPFITGEPMPEPPSRTPAPSRHKHLSSKTPKLELVPNARLAPPASQSSKLDAFGAATRRLTSGRSVSSPARASAGSSVSGKSHALHNNYSPSKIRQPSAGISQLPLSKDRLRA